MISEIADNDKTYVARSATVFCRVKGKFWADAAASNQLLSSKEAYFSLTVYELEVVSSVIQKNPPEKSIQDESFRVKSSLRHISFIWKDKVYEISTELIRFLTFDIHPLTHQVYGSESFGEFDAKCFFTLVKLIAVPETEAGRSSEPEAGAVEVGSGLDSAINRGSTHERGLISLPPRVEGNGLYVEPKYFNGSTGKIVGDGLRRRDQSDHIGIGDFLSTVLGGLFSVFALVAGIFILFHLKWLAFFFISLWILNSFGRQIYRFIFPIFLLVFISTIVLLFSHSYKGSRDSSVNPVINPPLTPRHSEPSRPPLSNDSVTSRFWSWRDYQDSNYTIRIQSSQSSVRKSETFKNQLNPEGTSLIQYDFTLVSLANRDSSDLTSIYSEFASLKYSKEFTQTRFAEILVSFVQSIPYALVVPEDCDSSKYNSLFIKTYLSLKSAICDGNQKFGINTPIEFMDNFLGDCDTRTLFLFTLLRHFGYRVAIFSSEYYGHSLLGVDLPYPGFKIRSSAKEFTLWETTALGCYPGVISSKISDKNYWRISLDSN